ncbi:unnamed protein product [Trifolium pratense]|uniref:Uncharacterized protein n=1 Tax=Trifolium pratense TaxID=57577 RepID=A0ACB0JD69_TRIPR|nr:unnamed protein product [Trifolium pratense]
MTTFLLRKNLLFFTSSHSTFQPRTLLLRLQLCEFSSSPTPYSHWKRHDEESRNVRVSVWWDFENCNIPAGVNVSKVAPAITDAVRANGIKGPVHITAYGDVLQLSRPNQEALAFTGIHLSHVPNGGKNSADRSLLVDLMYWVSQNPPPAHLFLISGDRDFAGILHRLRMNNYNILLAIPEKAPDVLCSAATIMWQWTSLLKGENLTGKHFNHPPDGQFGSWYGNSKVPLENPFSAAEQSPSSQKVQIVEINEPSSDLQPAGGKPESVVRIIKHILNLHPNGIAVSDLRAELTECNVSLGRNIFGYKRLYRFLSSIPNLHLQKVGNGNFCVKLLPSESPEPSESSTTLSTASAVKNEERGYTTTPKLHSEDKDMDKDIYKNPSLYSLQERIIEDDSKSLQSIPSQGRPIEEDVPHESSLGSEKVVDVSNAQLSETQLSPKDNDVSKTEIGSFKVRSKKSFDDDIVRSEDASPKVLEEYTTSGNLAAGIDHTMVENNDIASYDSGKSIGKNKHVNQPRKEVDDQSPYTSAADDSLVEKRPDGCVETYSKRSTFFSWIRSWWPFGKSNAKTDDMTAHQNKVTSSFEDSKSSELNQTASNLEEPKPLEPQQEDVRHSGKAEDSKLSELDQTANNLEEPKLFEPHKDVNQSGKPALFSSGSFWNDMESFVFSPKGSLLISQSRSREDLAHKLQKYHPVVLKSLTKNDIFQLVELLIAEKKWLEESPSQAFPFKLTRSVQKTASGLSNDSNSLRSFFITNRTSQSNLPKSFENDKEKHTQSIQQTGVPRLATENKHTERSRSVIFRDCEKLVTDILREHPEGYNISSIRKQFNNRYGYDLDFKKLGYKKMAYLIQIMPGVKVESSHIYPSAPAVCGSDSETSILKTVATNGGDEKFNSDNELSDTAPKEYNMESLWEELGPVSAKNLDQNDLKSNLSQKAIKLDTPKNPDYEPVVSDYDSSDTEGDSSCLTKPEDQGKPKYDEQDSSFWQALDSWHSTKEEENRVHKSENIVDLQALDSQHSTKEEENKVHKSENIVDLSNSLFDILNSSTESKQGVVVSKNTSGNYREKQRSQKYSFVADPALPNKDKFLGGLLNGLKKEDESKMQN